MNYADWQKKQNSRYFRMRQLEKLRRKVKKHAFPILLKQYGPVCWYCGLDLTGKPQTIDHIVPLHAVADPFDVKNLALTCIRCNRAKGDNTLEEFYAWFDHVRSTKYNNRVRGETGEKKTTFWQRLVYLFKGETND